MKQRNNYIPDIHLGQKIDLCLTQQSNDLKNLKKINLAPTCLLLVILHRFRMEEAHYTTTHKYRIIRHSKQTISASNTYRYVYKYRRTHKHHHYILLHSVSCCFLPLHNSSLVLLQIGLDYIVFSLFY